MCWVWGRCRCIRGVTAAHAASLQLLSLLCTSRPCLLQEEEGEGAGGLGQGGEHPLLGGFLGGAGLPPNLVPQAVHQHALGPNVQVGEQEPGVQTRLGHACLFTAGRRWLGMLAVAFRGEVV